MSLEEEKTGFTDLPAELQKDILVIAEKETWASAVKNLVEREKMKLENEAEPITVNMRRRRTGLSARIFGQYDMRGDVLFEDLDHIRERMENLNVVRGNPAVMRDLGFTRGAIDMATDSLIEGEQQMLHRGRMLTGRIQRQLEKDIKTVNYLNHLLKKSYNNV